MCTSIAMKTTDFYFGRTMDLTHELFDYVVLTPRNYPFVFRQAGVMPKHYALLGAAMIADGFPLYAEAVNEKGLCMAGLNFPDNAYYTSEPSSDCSNVSPFELIYWVLGKCATIAEAKTLLAATNLINIPFNENTPLAPLHWHIADCSSSITLESTKEGMSVFDNDVGVLTNNPTFQFQMTNMCQYLNLTTGAPQNCFSEKYHLLPFGQGLGSFGLPGDYSPASRFIKAAYLNINSVNSSNEQGSIAQLFHILDAVSVIRGSIVSPENQYDITTYSCCINATKGIYYYKTYSNNQLNAIDMNREDLDGTFLKRFPLVKTQQIAWAN